MFVREEFLTVQDTTYLPATCTSSFFNLGCKF